MREYLNGLFWVTPSHNHVLCPGAVTQYGVPVGKVCRPLLSKAPPTWCWKKYNYCLLEVSRVHQRSRTLKGAGVAMPTCQSLNDCTLTLPAVTCSRLGPLPWLSPQQYTISAYKGNVAGIMTFAGKCFPVQSVSTEPAGVHLQTDSSDGSHRCSPLC